MLAAAVSAGTVDPGAAAAPPGRDVRPDEVAVVELQRQVNEIRSDLLDERERRIDRRQEANGAVLVVLGVLIGIGGLWTYAKFHAIAREARIGAAAARAHVAPPRDLLHQPGLPGEEFRRLEGLACTALAFDPGTASSDVGAAGPAAEPWACNGHRSQSAPKREFVPGFGPAMPRRTDLGTPGPESGEDDVELQRCEDVVADCTEAIRLSPDDPQLYLERGNSQFRLGRYEEAVADYDRVIRLDPGMPRPTWAAVERSPNSVATRRPSKTTNESSAWPRRWLTHSDEKNR